MALCIETENSLRFTDATICSEPHEISGDSCYADVASSGADTALIANDVENKLSLKYMKQFKSKHPKNLIVSHYNVNSMRNKIYEILPLLHEHLVDNLATAATKIDDWSPSDQFHIQYIPRNMYTVFALLCFMVVIHWLIFQYPSGLLHWHCGNLTIAPVPAKQPWWIWINTSCEFIMNDCITTTKQSTTKPCAYFVGYTVPNYNLYRQDRNCQGGGIMVYIKDSIPVYSRSQEICTRFCCALLCCGYAIVHNEFTWSIYPYSSGLLCWHWGNR